MKKPILTSIIAMAVAMPAIAAIPGGNTGGSTVNLTWDSNGGSTVSGVSSCTSGSTFNLPTAPTRVGYTFAGWAVAQNCFANYTDSTSDWDNGSRTNTTGQNGTWTATSQSGNVATGISKCSSTDSSATAGTPSDENGENCWCQVSTYTPNGGTLCNVSSPAWVFSRDFGSASDCASYCAYECASLGYHVRCPLFGVPWASCNVSGGASD